MSLKTEMIKKVHRRVRKAKTEIVNGIAKEILTLPLRERIKLAFRIVVKGKL